jgi:hypothetical protein
VVTDEADRPEREGPFEVRFDVPAMPRIRNAMTGGDGNFSVDREVLVDLAGDAQRPRGDAGPLA